MTFFFFYIILRPPISTLFPYTTLFRSNPSESRTTRARTRTGINLQNHETPATPSPCSDRKSTRLNSSHQIISYAVLCVKKKNECCLQEGCETEHCLPTSCNNRTTG